MLTKYLPNFMIQIEEIREILNSFEEEIISIEVEINKILKNLFINDADLNGVKRYEKILEIVPKLTESIEIRKGKILSKYNQILPFTLENLILMLNSICGENKYILWIDYENFILNFRLDLEKKELKESIYSFLDRVVPVNMILNYDLNYNKWEDLNIYSWEYLNKYSWLQTKEEKMFN